MAGWTALAAVLSLALGLTGCGLPSRTDPRYVGPPMSAATTQIEAWAPPGPGDATTASKLISHFLQASVGGNMGSDGEQKTANNDTRDRLRQFMTDDLGPRWNPVPGLTIVKDPEIQEIADGPGQFKIEVTLQPIGKLTDSGEFQINTQTPDPIKISYTARTVAGGQLRLSGYVPDQLYLTVSGLKSGYDWQPIYFWESGAGQGKLVPDLRYMPRTLLQTKRAGQVLDWLRQGPSQWLQSVAALLPEAIEFKGTPVIENGVVKVNLGAKATKIAAGGQELTRLARQIRWSLATGPDHPAVRLTIENQSDDASSDNWLEDNVATRLPISAPDKYYVSGGTVRAAGSDAGPALFAPGGLNTQVVSAAINREGSRAALVRQVSKTQQQLFVSSDEQGPPKYEPTDVSAGQLSRPAWMNYPERRLLISDGTRLWVSTDASARKFDRVEPSNALQIGPITAFAVAPEGHRIALIANSNGTSGALIVAALQLVNGKLTIGSPQQIYTSLGDNQGVGWLTETTLVVGGAPSPAPPAGVPPYSLVAITVDGAEEDVLPAGATRPPSQTDVSKVVVRTNNPRDSLSFAWPRMPVTAMVESNGVAREVYRDSFGALSLGESTPTTPPSGEPPANPTAPFYPDY
ncbi:LpqB family beta-propeller domain-containing protein [Dactylosporangium sp. NPDC000555]|uniref:LpqB family beta-propeller domain-containing protein n=1 Tax=Dactylosporangium sp. NPDC000555 TaxID=3154260 RepID=UPI0033311BCF